MQPRVRQVAGQHAPPERVQRIALDRSFHVRDRFFEATQGLKVEAGVRPMSLGRYRRARHREGEVFGSLLPVVLVGGRDRREQKVRTRVGGLEAQGLLRLGANQRHHLPRGPSPDIPNRK